MEYRNWYWIPSNTHPTSLHDHGWCAAVPAMPRAYVGDVKLFRSAAYEDLAPADVKPRSRGAQGLRKKGCQKGIEVWKLMKQTEKIQSNLMYTIFMYINMIYIYIYTWHITVWYCDMCMQLSHSPFHLRHRFQTCLRCSDSPDTMWENPTAGRGHDDQCPAFACHLFCSISVRGLLSSLA